MKGRTWRWPLALAALTLFGLVAALAGDDGPWRWAAWAALATPPAIMINRIFA